jgi:hypothetical protein
MRHGRLKGESNAAGRAGRDRVLTNAATECVSRAHGGKARHITVDNGRALTLPQTHHARVLTNAATYAGSAFLTLSDERGRKGKTMAGGGLSRQFMDHSRATAWRVGCVAYRGCSLTRGAGSLDPRLISTAPDGAAMTLGETWGLWGLRAIAGSSFRMGSAPRRRSRPRN